MIGLNHFFIQYYRELLRATQPGLSLYTSRKLPWVLEYLEIYASKKEALICEKKLKKYSHDQIKGLIDSPKNQYRHLVDEWLKSLPNHVGDQTDVRCSSPQLGWGGFESPLTA
jgi:hypothetical protein